MIALLSQFLTILSHTPSHDPHQASEQLTAIAQMQCMCINALQAENTANQWITTNERTVLELARASVSAAQHFVERTLHGLQHFPFM